MSESRSQTKVSIGRPVAGTFAAAGRGIWKLLEGIDLTAFDCGVRSSEGQAGRPRICPQLLASLWIYGYRIGVHWAPALERMMSWEPGLRWLCADQEVNHHSLSDFRIRDKSQLDTLLTNLDCAGSA